MSVPRPVPLVVGRSLRLWGESLAELDRFVQRIAEVFDSGQGDNDGVAATIDLLNDPQKTSARIFPEIEREMLSFDPDAMIL